jgi:hypothetical protein
VARRRVTPAQVATRILRNTTADESGCLLWDGPVNRDGYGVSTCGKARKILVHRLVYEVAFQEDVTDRVVMHTCDTPRCVNPDHLRAGTQQDNLADMRKKGRARYTSDRPPWRGQHYKRRTHCSRGHAFTPENTRIRSDNGARRCLVCSRITTSKTKELIND